VRTLTLMGLSTYCARGQFEHTTAKPGVLNSLFSFEKKDAVSSADDAFTGGGVIDPHNNRVCNHFEQKQESSRILYPIWETGTDNLVFVPISLDFMSIGLGAPESSVKTLETCINNNDNLYFVLVKGVLDGKHGDQHISWQKLPNITTICCEGVSGTKSEYPKMSEYPEMSEYPNACDAMPNATLETSAKNARYVFCNLYVFWLFGKAKASEGGGTGAKCAVRSARAKRASRGCAKGPRRSKGRA